MSNRSGKETPQRAEFLTKRRYGLVPVRWTPQVQRFRPAEALAPCQQFVRQRAAGERVSRSA